MTFALPPGSLARIFVAISLSMLMTSAIGARPASATTPSVSTATYIASRLLVSMNNERARNGVPLLRSNSYLKLSAHRHNLWMARYNTLSHQLPGELYFSARITKAGYDWWMCGENAAYNTDWTLRGAYYLERLMYNEVAPYDGHRLNILNRHYRDVGIDIYMDAAHHKMWLTQDFGLRV